MDILSSRDWLTFSDCAKYLTKCLGEKILVSDVIRLIIDGKLTPSIRATGRIFAKKIEITDVTLSETISDTEMAISVNRELLKKEPVIGGAIIPYAKIIGNEIINISGVWTVKPIGIAKYEAEIAYSQEEGLSKPERSLYDIKGLIITDVDYDYQVQMMIDPEQEMLELMKVTHAHGGEDSGFVKGHVDKFKKAISEQKIGNFHNCLVPCTKMPSNTYFVIQMTHINKFSEEVKSQTEKKESSKTINKQAELLFALIATGFGKEAAINPRKYIDGKNGIIGSALNENGFKAPSGVTVEKWLKDVNL